MHCWLSQGILASGGASMQREGIACQGAEGPCMLQSIFCRRGVMHAAGHPGHLRQSNACHCSWGIGESHALGIGESIFGRGGVI